jgi:hypothetical protein
MPCPKCLKNPGYHSFVKFGNINGVNLFYTAPSKTADYDKDGTKLTNINIHIEEETNGAPWIWVLDCINMGIKHYTDVNFNTNLLKLLAKNSNIREVWIIHSNVWIRGVHSFFSVFSKANLLLKVSYFDGSKLDLMEKFMAKGLAPSTVEWLLAQ